MIAESGDKRKVACVSVKANKIARSSWVDLMQTKLKREINAKKDV